MRGGRGGGENEIPISMLGISNKRPQKYCREEKKERK